ncbi:outer membrane protein assembly factor BamE [Methylomonas sp. BW4-1]|uniref:Outer membrane protein assembly factor BamE n=1 Tax=Methylomonas defluvii TaxID=3045149 RepID=A0ABU4UIY7_9GAMM|nr:MULTISPECIES: outer membrane protein assembly factor BamE [unclassified Methylomonas]MDX8129451.1 outer membrane protein assembly factor BamE [Methylomonas sp. OY6]PKD41107.1 outer membrane protein assembly factor BamE [Methylomonas sp. Kb3]QBC27016.1 outer membrane protein assembly factor BamE [Methylomonas sp. LW13]
MKKSTFLLAAVTSLSINACSTILTNLPGVYTLDIEQGNIIDQSMINQLRPNMTKRQVLYIMGSPMLSDAFHEKRWDYLYSEQPGGEDRVQKRVSLFFNGDNLMGVQGDFRPSSMPVAKESTETSVDVPKRDLERSMWEKISGLFGSDEPDTFARRNNQNATEPKEAASSAEKGKELVEEDADKQ